MNRLRVLFLFFIAFFCLLIVRLFFIQVLNQRSYDADYTRTSHIEPSRGKILDRNREVLAINRASYQLFAEPKYIDDVSYYAHKLDEILRLGESTISARLDKTKVWVSIKDNLTKETKEQIETLHLKGLGFDEKYTRYYPESSLAAHLIGFVGKDDEGDDTGYFGVEGYYDQELAGLPGLLKSERDLLNRPIFFGLQQRVEAEDGRNLLLTIDNNVQLIAKKHLRDGVDRFKARSGCVIAVEPFTMEILALSCLPDYDPATYGSFTEEIFKPWIISSEYEPGSTFKPLVMAAAIENKKVKPDGIFNEEGSVTVGEYRIRNWNDKYEGPITFTRVLEKSSNVGMVRTGELLGKKALARAIKDYGFGKKTDIDLQGEASGQVKSLDTWYPIDAATMTFGQGISVTGLQLVRAFASLINGGYLMRPYVVRGVEDMDGHTKLREPMVERQVISKRTSDIMKKMLVSTVSHAEAKWDIPKGYTFGGKTGTAQIALEGSYDSSKTVASFIGFAPAQKPAFLMLVVINQPEASSWGSETAAPIFFDIARDILVYYNIPPN